MLRNIITFKLLTVARDTPLHEAAAMMDREDVGSLIVVEKDKPVGMITDRDIVVRCLAENHDIKDCTVSDAMTESVKTVKDTAGIFECIRLMNEEQVRRIPVVNDTGKPIGIVSFGDLLAILSKELALLTETTTAGTEQPKEAA